MAMPASRPPVVMTRTPATSPKANRSTKIGRVLGAVREREQDAGTAARPADPAAEQPAEGLGQVAAEGVLLPRGLQRREQHDDEHEVAGRGRPAVDLAAHLARVAGAGQNDRDDHGRDERHERQPEARASSTATAAAAPRRTASRAAAGGTPTSRASRRDRRGEAEVEVGQAGGRHVVRCRSSRSTSSPTSLADANATTNADDSSTTQRTSTMGATSVRPGARDQGRQTAGTGRRAGGAGGRAAGRWPSVAAATRRVSQGPAGAPRLRSRPSSSSDSNSGGDTLRPGHGDPHRAERDPRLQLAPLHQLGLEGLLDRGRRPRVQCRQRRRAPRVRRRGRRRRSRRPARTRPRRRTGSRASPTASVSLLIRSATSGIARSSSCGRAATTGSSRTPAASRNGSTRSVISSIDSIRMCAALIASAFFRSKRAGLGLTSPISNAADHLVEGEDVPVGGDRPAEQGEVVEQALGQEAASR